MRLSLASIPIITIALAACAGDDSVDEGEPAPREIGEITQALDPAWSLPACLIRSNSPPGLERVAPNSCAGPWRYTPIDEVTVADSHCPWKTCRHYSFG